MAHIQIGKTYRENGGGFVIAVRDVPRLEYRAFVNPAFEYVEVVDATRPDISHGWRQKHDGRHPLYRAWANHPNHLVLE